MSLNVLVDHCSLAISLRAVVVLEWKKGFGFPLSYVQGAIVVSVDRLSYYVVFDHGVYHNRDL